MEVHYVADVIFKEDAFLANIGHAAENIALLRRLLMTIIKTFDPKRGMADARRNSMFEPAYLTRVVIKVVCKKLLKIFHQNALLPQAGSISSFAKGSLEFFTSKKRTIL